LAEHGLGFIELLLVLVIVFVVVTVVVLVLVWLVPILTSRGQSALEVLERRFASGEIDADEFERRRALLLKSRKER
jgi:putative membrane protein